MRPNITNRKRVPCSSVFLTSVAIVLISYVRAEAPLSSEPLSGEKNDTSKVNRDVSNLQLTPDFRSVRLSWSYGHTNASAPSSFEVRFCEITSWNIEIKCRHKELTVAHARPVGELSPERSASDTNSSVIAIPVDCVQQDGSKYEAQLYGLRALTSYSFQVRVARFAHEQASHQKQDNNETVTKFPPSPASQRPGRGQLPVGRRIDFGEASSESSLRARVETKAFAAEASKCLHDVTEVVIKTGKFFSGRISAEDSPDPRCSLLGNKTSEQSSYLFRIDHQVCNSKIMDANRIETMVLVHENKDILTHNSARFLVVCNFHQKSYTLRASVALPKVNGVLVKRPALISALPGRPEANAISTSPTEDEEQAKSVMLGSMPGVYRARSPSRNNSNSSPNSDSTPLPAAGEKPTFKRTLSPNNFEQPDERANTIDNRLPPGEKILAPSRRPAGEQRQPKELQQSAGQQERSLSLNLNSNFLDVVNSNHVGGPRIARPMALAAAGEPASIVPRPVQIQSKVLYVDKSSLFSRGNSRELPYNVVSGFLQEPTPRANLEPSIQNNAENKDKATGERASIEANDPQLRQSLEARIVKVADEDVRRPVIYTNNHRIVGDFLPLAGSKVPPAADNRPGEPEESGGLSIKYSAAQVDEYPVAHEPLKAAAVAVAPRANQTGPRARNGRMRSVEGLPAEQLAVNHQVQRMGEMQRANKPPAGDLVADSSDNREHQEEEDNASNSNSTQAPSLAQNITGYLLRWSLKTLTNIAKKSLESLVVNGRGAGNGSLDDGGAEFETGMQRWPEASEVAVDLKQAPAGLKPATASTTLPPTTIQQQLKRSDEPKTSEKPVVEAKITAGPRKAEEFATRELSTAKPPRPSNYSKSLDLNRSLDSSWRTNNNNNKIGNDNQRASLNHGINQKSPIDKQQQDKSSSAQQLSDDGTIANWQDRSISKRGLLYSSWLLYGLLLFISLVTGVFLTFWLVSLHSLMASRRNIEDDEDAAVGNRPRRAPDGNLGKVIQRTLHPIVQFHHQLKPATDSDNNNNIANNATDNIIENGHSTVGTLAGYESCYEKYDFVHEPKLISNRSRMAQAEVAAGSPPGGTGRRSSASSGATSSSRSTRSTSANSSAVQETDCKDNEFLYTEHVLMNTGSAFGESFA